MEHGDNTELLMGGSSPDRVLPQRERPSTKLAVPRTSVIGSVAASSRATLGAVGQYAVISRAAKDKEKEASTLEASGKVSEVSHVGDSSRAVP